jgi:hypothetical protein
MPRLFVLGGPLVGRDFELAHGAVVGRDPDCEVVLEASSISRRHARFERRGASWFVVDLDSRNGVAVGGERVARAELFDLDELALGDVPLRFRLMSGESDGGPVLEGEELLESARARPARGAPVPSSAERAQRAEPAARTPAPEADAARAERVQLLLDLREEGRAGWLGSDLSQLTLGPKLLALTAALALGAGVLWVAWRGLVYLRGGG